MNIYLILLKLIQSLRTTLFENNFAHSKWFITVTTKLMIKINKNNNKKIIIHAIYLFSTHTRTKQK